MVAAGSQRSHRILVVDDEATIRHVLVQMLNKHPCETRTAGSAEEAAALLDDWEPDVALLDIAMPGKSGLDLLDEIKVRWPRTEVLIMTSFASTETVQRAIRGGAHDYLPKPFCLTELWATVERALDKRRRSVQHAAGVDRD